MGTARILVANGNEDVLAALEDVLSDAGFEVKTVHVRAMRLGAMDFREVFRSFKPDLALMDIGPPYPDNWAFARSLVDEPVTGGIPFLWTTTNARALAELTGVIAEELLLKPYELDHLTEKIRALLASRGRRGTETGAEPSRDASVEE
jgi:DNA-binding response OmpR family regulator